MSDPKEQTSNQEQLWFDPDWTCPKCRCVNMAVRQKCRGCGIRLDGEVYVYEAACLEVE